MSSSREDNHKKHDKAQSIHLLQNENEMANVVYVKKTLSPRAKKRLKWTGITLIILLLIALVSVFVVFPLVFMNSIELQRLLMFTNLGLPSDQSYFKKYEIKPGLRNIYVSVSDLHTKSLISLGVWHLLPLNLEMMVLTQPNFDFDLALKDNKRGVLLYFHGTGEDRSSTLIKYNLFRIFFHVITFDYRNYGDSTKNVLSEDAVVSDCVQLYEWLTTKTSAPIFVWGHSLGTALATRTLAQLNANVTQPVGLILEAPFTKMSEELYVHPYGRIFAWLPWFEATVIEPLAKNGFLFDTKTNILKVACPIMILCSEDDSIVPYRFGKELADISRSQRKNDNQTYYYQFDYDLGYDHFFLYTSPFVRFMIGFFEFVCTEQATYF